VDRANGRNRSQANKGRFDESEGTDSEGGGRENEAFGSNQDATAQQDEKTIDRALKQGMAQRSNRMEFDARLVYGETAGSGAVILFERGQRNLPPLTKQRTEFLAATTEPIFGKKGPSRYPDSDDNKKDKSDATEKKSTIDGLRN